MTLVDMRSKVRDWLARADSSLSDSVVNDFINYGIRNLERERDWKHMQTRETGNLVAGTLLYTTPSNYKNSYMFYVQDTNNEWKRLKRDDTPYVTGLYPDYTNDTGLPEAFTIDHPQSKVVLRPTPDNTYAYVHGYHAYSAALSADDDTNWWLTNADDVALCAALLEASEYIDDDSRLSRLQTKFSTKMRALAETQVEEDYAGSPLSVKSSLVMEDL